MENIVKQSSILEKVGVYSEDGKHRYSVVDLINYQNTDLLACL